MSGLFLLETADSNVLTFLWYRVPIFYISIGMGASLEGHPTRSMSLVLSIPTRSLSVARVSMEDFWVERLMLGLTREKLGQVQESFFIYKTSVYYDHAVFILGRF